VQKSNPNRPKTIKICRKECKRKLFDTGVGNDILDVIPKAQRSKKNQ
jgi:hypothetical protein